jgi:hypothetical protein
VLRFAAAAASVLAPGGRALLSIETPAGGAALHEQVAAALREVPVDVVTLSAPGAPLDLQAVAYGSLADGSLGSAYRAAARRYAEHLHALGGDPASALVVLRRTGAALRHVLHRPAPGLRRLGAGNLDAFLAGLDAAAAPDASLLASRVRTAPDARLAQERPAGRPDAPASYAIRFGGALAADHELGEAGAALFDILAGPGKVEDAVRRFAEACGERPEDVRDTVLRFVREGLVLAMLEVEGTAE